MKKVVFIFGLLIVISISSCSFETYQCPAYSQSIKATKYGAKAQAKYIKRHKL